MPWPVRRLFESAKVAAMHSLLRRVMVWLMVLAMPVQGIAAVTLQHCGPTHERMQAGLSAPRVDDGHSHDHAAAQPLVVAVDAVDAGSVDEADRTALPDSAVSPDATASCSACATCCSALCIPASTVRVAEPPVRSALVQRPAAGAESFVPAGLDRPPRPILA